MNEPEPRRQSGGGEETAVERAINRHLGNAIHVFRALLALLVLLAAGIATVHIAVREVPPLWPQSDEDSGCG